MKKAFLILLMLCAMAMSGISTASAGHFGFVGGASFMGIRDVRAGLTTGYHAGVTYKFKLPHGFAIQPVLQYHMKNSAYDTGYLDAKCKVGYLELPVSFQWGPDLLLFRPFFDVSPFIGCGLNQNFDFMSTTLPDRAQIIDSWKSVNRFEYGLGLGGGIEIWKIQLVCRYNWNFGSVLNLANRSDVFDLIRKELDNKNFGGVTLSVAILF